MVELVTLSERLNKIGYKSCVVSSGAEAKAKCLELIGGGSVGFGGSVTVDSLKLYETLSDNGNEVFWHWKGGPEMKRKAMFADYYLCSANALTEDGCIVQMDGSGNRIAALSFGPRNAIVVIGKNKIVKDRDEAIARIKSADCTGRNGIRLGYKTPCAVIGKCTDCKSPDRMCSVLAIFERPSKGIENVYVILINEVLGY